MSSRYKNGTAEQAQIGIVDGREWRSCFPGVVEGGGAVEAYAQKSISELELGASDFAVLEAQLHKGPLPVNEIGKKVQLTSGSITVAVDRLETKGLVERRAHGTDRRA